MFAYFGKKNITDFTFSFSYPLCVANYKRGKTDLGTRVPERVKGLLFSMAAHGVAHTANVIASDLVEAGVDMLTDMADPPGIPEKITELRAKIQRAQVAKENQFPEPVLPVAPGPEPPLTASILREIVREVVVEEMARSKDRQSSGGAGRTAINAPQVPRRKVAGE